LVGAIGCSQTRDVFTGIDAIGAEGYWRAGAVSGYGGGSLHEWADAGSIYWDYLETNISNYPETTDIWIELCIVAVNDTVTDAELQAGEAIINHVRAIAPTVTLHVSAMNDYAGIVCAFTPAGPAVSRVVADHLTDNGFALKGPVVGPLDATMVSDDGCHANEAGMVFQAQQLEAYFTGSPPPSTTTTVVPTPSLPFVDIAGSLFVDDIIWLAEQGITSGCNPPANDQFCPDALVTRGQMASFLSRALGLPVTEVDLFVDDETSEHELSINALGAAEITLGCNPPDNNRYCPSATVTRAQMASFLVRAYNLPAGLSDLFGDDSGSVHEADINALGWSGITLGCNPPQNDLYCPTNPVTRQQMAAFLHRAAGLPR
jgi:hypothetical protein